MSYFKLNSLSYKHLHIQTDKDRERETDSQRDIRINNYSILNFTKQIEE